MTTAWKPQGEKPQGWKPRGVSFGAGGVRLIGHMGCMTALMEAGILDEVTDWYGCSAGSVSALLGALGVSPRWIRDVVAVFDARMLPDIQTDTVVNFLTQWGVSSTERFIEYLGRLMDTWEPGSSSWTFADLVAARPGAALYIIATNVSQQRLDVFSYEKTPNMRLLDAIRASCAIPIFFTPWVSPAGDCYCDGGIIETFPWADVKDHEHTLVVVTEDSPVRQQKRIHTVTSFSDYISTVFRMLMNLRSYHHTPGPRYWLAVNNQEVKFMDFDMGGDARDRLFADGEETARRWLAFRQKASQKGTAQSPPLCEDPGSDASGPDAGDRMSDTLKSQSPLQPQVPSQGLHTASTPPVRRWSL